MMIMQKSLLRDRMRFESTLKNNATIENSKIK